MGQTQQWTCMVLWSDAWGCRVAQPCAAHVLFLVIQLQECTVHVIQLAPTYASQPCSLTLTAGICAEQHVARAPLLWVVPKHADGLRRQGRLLTHFLDLLIRSSSSCMTFARHSSCDHTQVKLLVLHGQGQRRFSQQRSDSAAAYFGVFGYSLLALAGRWCFLCCCCLSCYLLLPFCLPC